MRIAIVSDTHSRYATVEAALQLIEAKKVELILHCGDIEDAETVWLFPGNTHFVFGNCDTERASLRQAIYGIGATLHEPFGQLELDGVNLAFVHGDDHELLNELAHSAKYDYVCHGHTHVAAEHRTGPTRVINPGALHRARPKSFAILDIPSGAIEAVAME
ncbi:MAG TPA: YfcE family phosphodiesterase [Gemmataceae bacterium]|nr:YfcE family phosphodiesterase [Gemmataceae bacterium]